MKKSIIMGFIISSIISYAQVGIGSNVTTFDDSEVLKIVSPNKGVLFPNISIPNLNNAAPVSNPANSLIAYNTNSTSGKGYYIWQTNKWSPIINSSNIYKYLGIIKTTTAVSTSTITDSGPNGANTYSNDEAPSAHDWKLIPNLSKTIDIYSAVNNVSINVGGIVQVNSSSATANSHSYAVAIFIDNKLASARNFIISGNTACLYNDFNIFMSKNNLSVGSHTIAVYQTYRVNLSNTSGATLSFGGRLGTCTNLSDDMSRSILNIQLTEKP